MDAAALWLLAHADALLTLPFTVIACGMGLAVLRRIVGLFREDAGPYVTPYGVGPCEPASIVYPSLYRLEVREVWQ